MSELEEVSFWPGSSDGSYSRVGPSSTPMVSCRRRTVLIIAAVVALLFIIAVSIPSGMLQHYKSNEATMTTTAPPGEKKPAIQTTAEPPLTTIKGNTQSSSTVASTVTTTTTTTTTTPAPIGPTPAPPSYRLPTTVMPVQYDLNIDLDLIGDEKNKSIPISYKGTVEILLYVNENISFLFMHAVKMTISNIKVKEGGEEYKELPLSALLEIPEVEQIKIEFTKSYEKYTNLTLKLTFNNTLNDENNLHGFYKSSYKASADAPDTVIATTQFESVFARQAFPCFDEPSFKAMFALNITRPKEWISLFNTPLVSSMDTDDGNVKDIYGYSPVMSSYLVAFMVCDFGNTSTPDIISIDSHNISITVYGQKSQVDQLEYAAETAGKIIRRYEDFFGFPYPLPKLDIAAVPDFSAGAMENWGLITFREVDLLYKNGTSSSRQKQRVASVLAHELAHQWFGNLVTMEWWNELWLNEGFATFVGEMIGLTHIADIDKEDWPVEDDFKSSVTRAFDLDALRSSHSLSQQVGDVRKLADIEAMFDSISYHKGSAIISMLDNFVTRSVTQNALQMYLGSHLYSNAKASDLWEAFDLAYTTSKMTADPSTVPDPMAIATMMTSWTESVGYPVVNAKFDSKNITLSQSRFLVCKTCDGVTPGSQNTALWHIPISYSNEKEPYMLIEKNGSIDTNKWLKLNLGWNGFYLVKYDNYTQIDLTLLSDANIANLVYDALILFRGTQLEPAMFVKLLNDVANSASANDYLSLRMVLKASGYLLGLYGLKYDEYEAISPLVYSKLKVQEMDVTFGTVENMSAKERNIFNSKLSIALSIDHDRTSAAVKGLTELKQIWTDSLTNETINTTGLIHKDVAEQIGTCAFLSDEANLWMKLWDNYVNSPVPSEQSAYMRILASGNNVPLLVRLLEKSDTKPGDRISLITEVASTSTGRIIAWDYVKRNAADLNISTLSGFASSQLIRYTTNHFTDEGRLDEARKLFGENVGAGADAAQQSFEILQSNIDLVTKQSKPLVNAIKAQN